MQQNLYQERNLDASRLSSQQAWRGVGGEGPQAYQVCGHPQDEEGGSEARAGGDFIFGGTELWGKSIVIHQAYYRCNYIFQLPNLFESVMAGEGQEQESSDNDHNMMVVNDPLMS